MASMQPVTFDLDTEKQAFEEEFNRIALLNKLQDFLKLFTFEENPENCEPAEIERRVSDMHLETQHCLDLQLTSKLNALLEEASHLLTR
jgi:hypothetical protein